MHYEIIKPNKFQIRNTENFKLEMYSNEKNEKMERNKTLE